jgi:hypothetical protein
MFMVVKTDRGRGDGSGIVQQGEVRKKMVERKDEGKKIFKSHTDLSNDRPPSLPHAPWYQPSSPSPPLLSPSVPSPPLPPPASLRTARVRPIYLTYTCLLVARLEEAGIDLSQAYPQYPVKPKNLSEAKSVRNTEQNHDVGQHHFRRIGLVVTTLPYCPGPRKTPRPQEESSFFAVTEVIQISAHLGIE